MHRLACRAEVIGVSRSAPPLLRREGPRQIACDLRDARAVRELLDRVRPDAVVTTHALSDVDRCEQAPDEARAQNVDTVCVVADGLGASSVPWIHLSTDYVFDGTKGSAYVESDPPNPLGVYGRSKREGELIVLGRPCSLVVRTSTLFGEGRANFCDYVAGRLLAEEPVEAFHDQRTSPTYTKDLAAGIDAVLGALAHASDPLPARIVHMANDGGCSRVAFAQRIADLLRRPRALIRAIPMAAQQRPAPRPTCSILTTEQLPQLIGERLRPWDDALDAYLRDRHWIN